MPELVDVVDAKGNKSRVSVKWLTRWPGDFKKVTPKTSRPVPVKAAKAATDSPTGDKKKEK